MEPQRNARKMRCKIDLQSVERAKSRKVRAHQRRKVQRDIEQNSAKREPAKADEVCGIQPGKAGIRREDLRNDIVDCDVRNERRNGRQC
jgi:hypothetical protein